MKTTVHSITYLNATWKYFVSKVSTTVLVIPFSKQGADWENHEEPSFSRRLREAGAEVAGERGEKGK